MDYGDSLLNPFFPWLSPPAVAALGHMMGQSRDDEAGKAGHERQSGINWGFRVRTHKGFPYRNEYDSTAF
jgi:hypothetical protein